ncbi:MAG: hypothetical protein EOP50_17300 [Sphingobacteriales bacterium]|nr:MAG: hypothetical protein EOP50_17300 [Sphingobacteriales bacterium]
MSYPRRTPRAGESRRCSRHDPATRSPSALPELEQDQFYFHEIIGYKVHDAEAGELGTVREIFAMPTQDLIAMDYNGTEVLIPIMDDIVEKADKETKTLYVNLPEGLLEVYTNPGAPDDADEEEDLA